MSTQPGQLVKRCTLIVAPCGVCAARGPWAVWDQSQAQAICPECYVHTLSAEALLVTYHLEHPDNQLVFKNP